ncbi:hypothetical protein MF406_13805 [Georgenia sp. TF02-10]|uniref:hypothetical protein n=1 Tax=Georgenia sp. TF02-10 TaxID=2917725 RepID=UPI001FA7E34B|nr:hypothetical protein [Georgenia sp. TF02-10]UNX54020.1 hypothetical protein MF406_13805 [Georgenia sp. TF02-10]
MSVLAIGLLMAGVVGCSGSETPPEASATPSAAETPASPASSTDPETETYLSFDPDLIAEFLEERDREAPGDTHLSRRLIAEEFSGSQTFDLPPVGTEIVNYRATVVCRSDNSSSDFDTIDVKFETSSTELIGIRGQACGTLSVPTIEPPDGLIRDPGITAIHVTAPASTQIVLIVHELAGESQ